MTKKREPHPCLICGELTTGKTYCDTHLMQIKKPQFMFRSSKLIYADISPSKSGQRKNSVNDLR